MSSSNSNSNSEPKDWKNIVVAPAHIRHRGDPKTAETLTGDKVRREEKLWVEQDKRWVECRYYDNHFIYRSYKPNSSAFMCTCGSPAVIIEIGTDKENEFVCLYHEQHNAHQTGERSWV